MFLAILDIYIVVPSDGGSVEFQIDHRLESVDTFDAILPIIIGSHIFTK